MKNTLTSLAAKASLVSTSLFVAGTAFAEGELSTLGGDVVMTDQKGYAANIGTLISSILSFVMLIAALMILIYMIWGGIQWVTSGGDSGKTEEARNKITAAVVGLIILAAAWAVFLIVVNFLGFSGYTDLFSNLKQINAGG
ncbi:MAG: hypothetical protein COY80_00030 [Candidatus Pacebacteria bacterium CG_4_10_14_0_8_um_filter_42_14]|nr:MAG: hypothetical protein COY80_00030 [Candidatus Pacebacteria bacterium CG_4_10_14_0_8_um_filter_42_14]